MGYGHILLVRDDAINVLAKDKPQDELAMEVGRAVLKVCLHPDYAQEAEALARIRSAEVFNYANGVEWAGERHTTNEDVFLWASNALMAIDDWDTAVLERVLAVMREKLASRQRSATRQGRPD